MHWVKACQRCLVCWQYSTVNHFKFYCASAVGCPSSKVQRQADAAPSWDAELERLLRALSDDEELLDEASHALQAATTGMAFDASPAVAALVRHCDTPSRRGQVASRVFYLQQDVEQRAAHEAADAARRGDRRSHPAN